MKKHNLLENHLGYWLRSVSNQVSLAFAKKLATHDIGVADWVVLNLFQEQPNLSPAKIADAIGMTRGATSKLLDRLFEKKLILRSESKTDRRYQEITLSDQAHKLLPKLMLIADNNDAHFFGHLSKKQKMQITAILKEIVTKEAIKKIPIT